MGICGSVEFAIDSDRFREVQLIFSLGAGSESWFSLQGLFQLIFYPGAGSGSWFKGRFRSGSWFRGFDHRALGLWFSRGFNRA